MNWILLNVPLAVLMVGFAAGLPLWVMLKHAEENYPVALDSAVLRPGRAPSEYVSPTRSHASATRTLQTHREAA
jgi:hypothetical protein